MGLHVVDDQRPLVVGGSAPSGLADQRLKALLPARLRCGFEPGKMRVPRAEGNRRGGAVQPERGAHHPRLGQAQQLDSEVQVPGGPQRIVLTDDGQRR